MMRGFAVTTRYDTILARRRSDGQMVHLSAAMLAEQSLRYHQIVCTLSGIEPKIAQLVGLNRLRPFKLEGDPWKGPVLSYRMVADDLDNRFGLQQPQTGRFLKAAPPDESGIGLIAATGLDLGADEAFGRADPHLAPIDADALESSLESVGAHELLRRIEHRAVRSHEAFAAEVRALPEEDLQIFVDLLKRDPATVRRLARIYPRERWAWQAFEALVRWDRRGRPQRNRVACGKKFAFLDQDTSRDDWGGVAQICNRMGRKGVVPRKNACILTSMRNEGIYIIEWIAYHRLIGFDHFFVYYNNNSDDSDFLLNALAKAGVITLIRNDQARDSRPQYKAYGHALKVLPEILDYRWAAVLDADEFVRLEPGRFNFVKELLDWHDNIKSDSIGLRWRMFGSNGLKRWEDKLVLDRFQEAIQNNCPFLKSIFRPSLFSHANPHFATRPFGGAVDYKISSGEPHYDHSHYESNTFTHAWIDHFYFKSIEEVIVRRTQTDGCAKVDQRVNFDLILDHTVDWIRSTFEGRIHRHHRIDFKVDAKVAEEVEKLLALPGVRKGQRKAVAGFQKLRDQALAVAAQEPRLKPGAAPHGWAKLWGSPFRKPPPLLTLWQKRNRPLIESS